VSGRGCRCAVFKTSFLMEHAYWDAWRRSLRAVLAQASQDRGTPKFFEWTTSACEQHNPKHFTCDNTMAAETQRQPQTALKQHVPAWKRLGLKLKYAQDVEQATSEPQPDNSTTTEHGILQQTASNKRKLNDDEVSGDQEQASKKAKKASKHSNQEVSSALQSQQSFETPQRVSSKQASTGGHKEFHDGDAEV
jgi:hypothetical protein